MRDFCFYGLYRAGTAVFAALPLRLLFRLGHAAGFCAWLVLPHYRKLAFRNTAIAFGGERTPRELRQLVRSHFCQLGANLFSSVKLATMSVDEIAKHVEMENLDAIHQPLRAGRGVVVIISHLGNWELFAQIFPKYVDYVRNATIYQRLGNRLIDEHVRQARARAGVEMFDRREGFQKAIELLRGGGVIGILSDQHAGDQGLWVPFFGKLASTTPLPALLAKRTGALLVGIASYTTGVARWRIVVGPVLKANVHSVEALTAQANEAIAEQIRQAPDDWFWVHNRWKTPRPNFLLHKYKRGLHVPPAIRPEQLKPFRILIRGSNWLGDAVMSVPAVRAIKAGRPDAHVTVATPKKIAAMWRLIPEVDDVLVLPSTSLFSTVRAFRRPRRFDVAVLFPNSLRVALEAWLAGIPRRVGYRGHHRVWLLNQIVRQRTSIGRIEHQAVQYLRIAHNLGAEVPDPGFEFNLVPNEALRDDAKLALCPGAEYGPAKRWLPERFVEVASAIAGERSAQWMLFGTLKDAEVGQTIAAGLGEKCVNRIGQTTLQQLIDELQTCRLLLTNDTGTMHLAALLGIPTVSIFGSTEPLRTGPLGDGHIVLRHHVECSPCFLRECPLDFRCMKAVTVEEATAAIRQLLQGGRGLSAATHRPKKSGH